jgi:hypothetical protein
MQKYYKLLSQKMTSHNDTKWELNAPIKILKPGIEMCSDQVLHCYNHPLLASFLNPIHGNISNPRLFLIEVDEIVNNDGLKFASKSQTILEEIPYIDISLEKGIEIGIRVTKTVYKDKSWNEWADRWLSGTDRSRESARYAYSVAHVAHVASAAAYYAAHAASAAAYYSAYYAAHAVAVAVAVADYYAEDKTIFNKKLIEIVESVAM